MRKIVFFILTALFMVVGCENTASDTEDDHKGKACSYYAECKGIEICLKGECVPSDSYDCTANNDICPKDLVCSHVSGKCKPVECSNHSECAAGQFCNGSFCKTECKYNSECGENYLCDLETGECKVNEDINCLDHPNLCTENEVCNTETKKCIPKVDKECMNDFECDHEHGQYCNTVTNKCEDDPDYCEDDTTCDTNFECKAHHCEPIGGAGCAIDEECDNGLRCNNGEGGTNTCVQCIEDSDCVDSTCDLTSKKCIVTQSCTDDSTCPEGTKCVMSDGMMPGMPSGGGDLPGGSEGSCQEVEVCYVDADCNPDGVAEEDYEKFCKDAKAATETEPAETGYCATKNNFDASSFLDILGLCNDDDSVPFLYKPCPEGQSCVNYQCYAAGSEPECSNDSECATLYPERENQICERGGCIEDPTPRCPNGETDCSDQMHCDTSEQVCYSCVTDAHCGDNSVCRDHNCVNSSFCEDDSDCQSGMTCRANVCR